MSDVWVYGEADGGAGELVRTLAETGSTATVVPSDGGLRPMSDAHHLPQVLVVTAAPNRICRELAEDEQLSELPVVVAVDEDQLAAGDGLVVGHELIVRPCSGVELTARISRARRRANGGLDTGDVIRLGSLELNVATYEVTVAGHPIDFTYMEYELLKYFATHAGRAFSRETLLSQVWGYDYFGGARTVDVHVRRIRAKLGQEHAGRIRTVRGVGYRWEGA